MAGTTEKAKGAGTMRLGAAASRRDGFWSRNRKGILIAGAVIALAAVILVGAAIASSPTVKTPNSPEAQAGLQSAESIQLADQGYAALSNNDTATAQRLFARAIALNPQNQRAADGLAQLKAPTTSGTTSQQQPTTVTKPSGGSSGSTTPAASDPFDKPVADLVKLLPLSLSGYTMMARYGTDTDSQVTADSNALQGLRITWYVHDRGSKANAAKFIGSVSKAVYPKNARMVTIDGAQAYNGSDGARIATVAYQRGRFVFEVLVNFSGTNVSQAQAMGIAQTAGAAFPDKP